MRSADDVLHQRAHLVVIDMGYLYLGNFPPLGAQDDHVGVVPGFGTGTKLD